MNPIEIVNIWRNVSDRINEINGLVRNSSPGQKRNRRMLQKYTPKGLKTLAHLPDQHAAEALRSRKDRPEKVGPVIIDRRAAVFLPHFP